MANEGDPRSDSPDGATDVIARPRQLMVSDGEGILGCLDIDFDKGDSEIAQTAASDLQGATDLEQIEREQQSTDGDAQQQRREDRGGGKSIALLVSDPPRGERLYVPTFRPLAERLGFQLDLPLGNGSLDAADSHSAQTDEHSACNHEEEYIFHTGRRVTGRCDRRMDRGGRRRVWNPVRRWWWRRVDLGIARQGWSTQQPEHEDQ
jgi:hypothetical protein